MKTIEVVAAVIIKEGKVFCTERGYGKYKGWWEFPGGKLEKGETNEEALVREIKEELSTLVSPKELITTVEYDYPDFHLCMHCYRCEVINGELTLNEHLDAKWLTGEEINSVNWLPADIELIEIIKKKYL